MERISFLSHVLDAKTPLYGGKKNVSFVPVREMCKGEACNTMCWSLGNHSGTHVDAPRHFIAKGRTADRFTADSWMFHKVALVVLKGVKPGQIIGLQDVGLLPKGTELVLIKTGFERFRGREVYWKNAPGLHPDLAGGLKKMCPKVRAVGMDIISVSNLQERQLGHAAHVEFLKRNILLIEDMKFSSLTRSPRKVLVAPLRVKDSDAAPCSVFAWEVNERSKGSSWTSIN